MKPNLHTILLFMLNSSKRTNNKGYEEINNYNFCDKTFVTRNNNQCNQCGNKNFN